MRRHALSAIISAGMTSVLACMTLGAIGVALGVLTMQCSLRVSLPLALFFAATGVLVAPMLFDTRAPGLLTACIALSLPAALGLGPALWRSIDGLTIDGLTKGPTPATSPRAAAIVDLALPGAGLLVSIAYALLPRAHQQAMLLQGELPPGPWPAAVALISFLLVLLWIPQSGFYLFRVGRRLLRHRGETPSRPRVEGGELAYAKAFLLIITLLWMAASALLLADNVTGVRASLAMVGATMAFGLTWSVSVWTLRMQPVPTASGAVKAAPSKYERSVLSDARAARILRKLDAAMAQDRLYLDPDLSLEGLSNRIGAPRNHVSQTLNSLAGETFFQYVNRYRVEAAKPLVRAGDRTAVEIAVEVGFNARSSFYKAFKRATGMTPKAYRDSHSAVRPADDQRATADSHVDLRAGGGA